MSKRVPVRAQFQTIVSDAAVPSARRASRHRRPLTALLARRTRRPRRRRVRRLLSPATTLAASSSSQLVLQDTGTQFQWSAGWRLEKVRSASGGSLHASGRAGATVSVVFYGSSVQVLAATGRAEGSMRVTLDGTHADRVQLPEPRTPPITSSSQARRPAAPTR